MRITLPLLALTLMIGPATAAAQPSLTSVHEQVTQMQDTAVLRQLEQQHVRGSTTADQITAGFAALQLWAITENRTHARRSRRYFDSAAKAEPDNAWAHYGHALSLEAEIRRGDGSLVTDDAVARALGYDAVSRSRRALERALELDPTLPGAAELLAEYAVRTRDDTALDQAREVYEKAMAEGRTDDDVLLGLASVAREMGDYDRSAEAAGMLAARGGDNIASAHLELAKSLASVPGRMQEAASAFGTALRFADGELLEQMWSDAAIITRTREDFDWSRAETDEQRRALLTTAWELRGALSDLSGPERAVEHYRRMNVAWQQYRRNGIAGAADNNALRLERVDPRFQDVGIIYIRHGAPDDSFGRPGMQYDYLVWFYFRDDGEPLSYHFVRLPTAGFTQDYTLIRTLPCPIDPAIASVDKRLYPLTVGRCRYEKTRSISANVAKEMRDALLTDSHRPALAREIPFHYDWYTFRGENGGTEVVAAIGVPFAEMPTPGMPLRLSLAVVDSLEGRVVRSATETPQVVADDRAGAMLRSFVRIEIEPTRNAAYRVGIRDAHDNRVGKTYGGPLVVDNYSWKDLLLISDIVLAEPSETGTFERSGHRLSLAPSQVFRGGEFKAFYEIYNLAPGTAYRTELEVRPANRGVLSSIFGGNDGVKLEFADVVPDDATDRVAELRDITAPFEPGEYILKVTIRADGMRPQTKERRFVITR